MSAITRVVSSWAWIAVLAVAVAYNIVVLAFVGLPSEAVLPVVALTFLAAGYVIELARRKVEATASGRR